jgi:adenine-specific DNA-methyltransferase
MAKKTAPKKATAPKVESIRHKATRPNIPTEELRDFVADDELKPQTLLYPRDTSLDPQLVWKGKDEQDRHGLSVPVVPIYIQEKIHPQAIIDALPRSGADTDATADLFADFNGLPEDFDQRVDFYHHEGHWSNRMILGDSLTVMVSLAEKEGLKGKVQTIYIDPPYGIKFGSNWQVSTRKRDVKDGKAEDATRQPEQVRAFRDTWQLGIHSYLAYLRDRLTVSRDLLTETGSVFVQIGDENVHLVRSLMDEVFGAENFVSLITVKKTGGLGTDLLKNITDYVVWYARSVGSIKYRQLFTEIAAGIGRTTGARYDQIESPDGETRRPLTRQEKDDPANIQDAWRPFQLVSLTSSGSTVSCIFPYQFQGKTYWPSGENSWKTTKDGMNRLAAADRLATTGGTLRVRRYLNDFPAFELNNVWEDIAVGADKVYVVQTAEAAIRRCVLMTTDPGDLVLDPTCGSGTTAYVAEQWGRRWITTDTSRVALALARTRLMAAKYPYYLLADSPEGIKKEADLTGKMPPPHQTENDIRKGFVYKRVPHVTLKSIANNPDIKEGMTREQIDAAIARHADTETLFDQPYEDSKRIRVSGPFTVESLSPHRTISAEEKKRRAEVGANGRTLKVIGPDKFGHMILDNLRTAGVQNTKKGERLKFDSVEVYPGQWVHGVGLYTDTDGKPRRAAICIGPEHGTVGATLIKEAAKEAVQGVGFDLLIVCGFAFDPVVSEEAKRYGKLTVLPTKMNPDLAMGEDLLKKTGAGNLFMVFGEPDVEIAKQKDGKIVVEVKGLDVYDPTTGEIRNASTDDIACWFIDTDYNGESFFVRHAYFTGADEPYEKLKRALKADIDEAAWSTLYSTTSRPFPAPSSGKIAVKIINHYGDEVMKVFGV